MVILVFRDVVSKQRGVRMGRRIRKRMVLFLLALFLLSAGYEKKALAAGTKAA